MADPFKFKTKLWKRGKNSYATTIPQNVLAIRRAPTENAEVEWEIDPESGDLQIEIVERDDE